MAEKGRGSSAICRRHFAQRLLAVGLGCALGAVELGCTRAAGTRGRAIRVVSISPSTTETMFTLETGSLVVGRSRYCDYPAQAQALPAVGGFADPSVEAIVTLRPTLVTGDRGPAGPALAEALGAHGISTYFPSSESVADISAMILGLGARVGRDAEARALVDRIEQAVAAIAHRAAAGPRVSAVLVFDASPIVVAGPGGFPDELLRLAGGSNVIDRGGAYPTVGIEHLLARDPDVVLDATEAGAMIVAPDAGPGASGLLGRPGWRELRAVRAGRVRVLQSSAALRPGPRIAEGLAEIMSALHGAEDKL